MRTIAIAGTNGKSTTTAMVGKILEAAGLDPTVFVGTLVPDWELGNLRIGKSDILVVEADEYKRKLLQLTPATAVITNIEEDHLDVYKDLNDIVATFQKFANATTGEVMVNADDATCSRIVANRSTFGFMQPATIWADDRRVQAGEQSFEVKRSLGGVEEKLGRITLRVPGVFNMMNALAATSVALSLAAPFAKIQEALVAFPGVWRRFERVGEVRGTTVISDYGHHPTAVRGTLAAAKEFFPGQRIVLCFQPHQHNRTRELFAEFVESFGDADVVILSEIYGVEGRTEEGERISSLDIVNAVQQRMPAGSDEVRPIEFARDTAEAEEKIRAHVRSGDVVIVMGAGDIDAVARKLVA